MYKNRLLTTTQPPDSSSSENTVGSELYSNDYCRSNVPAIVFPGWGQLRSRRVVSRSNSRSAGKYPSWKMMRMLHW
jgi:hypothetical protein